jgi:hypothetical protein
VMLGLGLVGGHAAAHVAQPDEGDAGHVGSPPVRLALPALF